MYKTLESPLDCKEIQPVHPKGDQSWIFIRRTDAEAEAPVLWPPDVKNRLPGKDPDAGKDWRQEKGMTEDKMAGWHHQLNGHEFKQAPGVGDGQGSLECCGPWGHRARHAWGTGLNVYMWDLEVLHLWLSGKHLAPTQEVPVRSLGQEDPLEAGSVAQFSFLAWRIPWTEDNPGRLQSVGSHTVRHNWSDLARMHGIEKNGTDEPICGAEIEMKMKIMDLRTQRGKEGEGKANWESSADIYTLQCIKETARGKLLHSTGSSAQGSVMTQRLGWRWWEGGPQGGDVCTHTADSLFRTAEINITL